MAFEQGRGFAVSNFMSKVDNLGGIARKNKFSVEITPPTSLVSEVEASAISFLAKTVSFPAKSFGSTTYRSGGRFGLEVPYETTSEPVSITMLNTNNHAPRKFWNSWFEHIQSMDSRNMQYYKKFIGTVKISCFDEKAGEVNPSLAKYQVTLHDAWPKTISAIELGWENSDLADFDIDIAYSWWTETN
tara:strand:+ start:1127 stop:1690 length:564 start_codon:yes stop_codon:yes gene_type:complete